MVAAMVVGYPGYIYVWCMGAACHYESRIYVENGNIQYDAPDVIGRALPSRRRLEARQNSVERLMRQMSAHLEHMKRHDLRRSRPKGTKRKPGEKRQLSFVHGRGAAGTVKPPDDGGISKDTVTLWAS